MGFVNEIQNLMSFVPYAITSLRVCAIVLQDLINGSWISNFRQVVANSSIECLVMGIFPEDFIQRECLSSHFYKVFLEEKKYISGREVRGFQNLKIFAILCFYLQICCSAYHWKSHEATFEAKSRFAAHIVSRFLVTNHEKSSRIFSVEKSLVFIQSEFSPYYQSLPFCNMFPSLGSKNGSICHEIPPNTVL